MSDWDKEFEQWYAENAFNFEANPIGSRDCGLQRKSWQARGARSDAQISELKEEVARLKDREVLPFAILPEEIKALRRFHECVMDNESYDVPKEMMKRLGEIGLVNHIRTGFYKHTDFGLFVLNGDFEELKGEAMKGSAQ